MRPLQLEGSVPFSEKEHAADDEQGAGDSPRVEWARGKAEHAVVVERESCDHLAGDDQGEKVAPPSDGPKAAEAVM